MDNVAKAAECTPIQPDVKPDQRKDAGDRVRPIFRLLTRRDKLLERLYDLIFQGGGVAWATLRRQKDYLWIPQVD